MKKAIREGTFRIGNVLVHAAVLEDGTRVIDAESTAALLSPDAFYTAEQVALGMAELQNL